MTDVMTPFYTFIGMLAVVILFGGWDKGRPAA